MPTHRPIDEWLIAAGVNGTQRTWTRPLLAEALELAERVRL